MTLHRARLAMAVAALFLMSVSAGAADFSIADETYVGSQRGGWDIRLTPYAWMLGMSGDITARGQSVNLDVNFEDILDKSDYVIPLMGYFEAKHDRLTLFGEAMYTQIAVSGSNLVKRQSPAGPALTISSQSELTQVVSFYEAGAAYEVARWTNSTMGPTSIDVLGGARYWHTSSDLSLKIKANVNLPRLGLERRGKFAIASSGSTDWVDPVIGLRIRQEFAPGQELQLLADIGGFGVGSEFTWQLFGGYSHVFKTGKTTIAGTAGYRILGVDYEEGSGTDAKAFDVILQGVIAGLSFRW